jgi:hypothetical protein
MAQIKRLPVLLDLAPKETTVKAFGPNPVEAMKSACYDFLEQLAEGGIMLSPQDTEKIAKNYGKGLHSARDVVKATEAQAGLEDGLPTYKFSLDPAWTPPLEQRARDMGTTLADLMRMSIDMALENNWLYGVQSGGIRRTFEPAEEEFFRGVTGKRDFTVGDIVTAYRKKKNVLREFEPEPEPQEVA